MDEFLGQPSSVRFYHWAEGLVSFSVTFVPMLLFTVVKTRAVNVAVKIYDFLLSSPVLAPSISNSETIQDLVDNNTSDQH